MVLRNPLITLTSCYQMDSHYAAYLKERTGQQIIETKEGFIAYTIAGQECFIEDLYVLPEFRKKYVGSHLVDSVAAIGKKSDCQYLTCSLAMAAKNKDESLKAFIGYGFKLLRATPEAIYFVKELH